MQKRLLLIALLLIFFGTSAMAYTERSLLQNTGDINKVLKKMLSKEEWIPYPKYSDRAAWDSFLGNLSRTFIQEGERMLHYDWKVIKATDYLEYSRSGDRKIMEAPFDDNITTVAVLLMAELAEGKGRFIDQLANGIFTLCEMTSWSISAHLSLQTSKIAFPDHKEQIIELVSGDIGSLLSWVHYFLRGELDKQVPLLSERLRYEIKRRILDPYMQINHLWWMGFERKPGGIINNWNPWCNANVLQCFALMETDSLRLAKAIYKTMQSTDKFLNYVKADGACEEGPSYWGHASGKLYDYLELLHDITGGAISIFSDPMIKRMGEYIVRSYVGNGWVVNFADASAKFKPDVGLIFRYGNAVKSKEMMQFASFIQKHEGNKSISSKTRDIFRLLETLQTQKMMTCKADLGTCNTPDITWYPETEFCYMQNRNGLFFAGKGGFNNESHNHNDVGSFNLYINKLPVIIDVGVGTYTRKTFSSERYSIWTMQSGYHNLPSINGYDQAFGADYKAVQTKLDSSNYRFSLDIANAYPKGAGIRSWIRDYRVQERSLVITDFFDLSNAKFPNRINFMTWGNVEEVSPGILKLKVGTVSARLIYESEYFYPIVEKVETNDSRLSSVWGASVYRIVLVAKKITGQGKYSFRIEY